MSKEPEPVRGPRSYLGLRIVAIVLLAFGLLVLYQSFQIPLGGGYSVVGPRFFPTIVGGGLLLLSVLFLLRTTLFPDEDLAALIAVEQQETHWPATLMTGAALVIYPFTLEPLGYIVATTLFVPTVAHILGSRHTLRNVMVGLILSVVIYIGFTRFLTIRLPAGLLEPIL